MDFAEKPRGSLPELGFREYVEALEVERQKVEVFQRELPLCLELVTQTIERCRQQLSSGAAATTEYLHGHQSEECNSEQTSSGEHHVFEEFIPLKRTCSPDEDEDEDEQEHESPAGKSTVGNKTNNNNNNNKEDWLRSVQLWNDPTADPPPQQQEDSETKALATEVRKNGGAFQPFQREKGNEGKSGAPASDPAASSSGGGGKREAKEGQRKQRRNWSPELHKRFVNALQQLGGSHAATPKQIREFMKVDGLTNDEVKSHLQKYRLHTRRPAQAIPSNGGAQTPQVVFVGGIWVQPTDYAAAVSGDPSSSGIYAPVAAHPHGLHRAHHHKRAEPASTHSSVERAAASHVSSEGARRHSNSPATSSSTHTTTTSHAF